MSSPSSNEDLRALAGEWSGTETIASSKWGAGGEARVSCSYRLALDGKALLHDYKAERDGQPWLSAHAVFTFDAQADDWSLFWFDSLGFVPQQPAAGSQGAGAFTFIRLSPCGRTRHTWRLIDANHYTLKLESSFDAGASWVPVMQGGYTRIA